MNDFIAPLLGLSSMVVLGVAVLSGALLRHVDPHDRTAQWVENIGIGLAVLLMAVAVVIAVP